MNTEQQKQKVRKELQKELNRLKSGKARTYSVEEADRLLERTIQLLHRL